MGNIKRFEKTRDPGQFAEGLNQLAVQLALYFYEYRGVERAMNILSSQLPALAGNVFRFTIEKSGAPVLYIALLASIAKEYIELATRGDNICDAIISLVAASAVPKDET